MDNVDTWVWILIAVVAVLLLLALVAALAKRGSKAKEERRLEQERQHREEAARLRDEAREASVTANQTAAGAAAARADADQARLDAERLERQAKDLEHEAHETKQHADHRLSKADEIDPDVTTDEHGNVVRRNDATDRPVAGEQHEHHVGERAVTDENGNVQYGDGDTPPGDQHGDARFDETREDVLRSEPDTGPDTPRR
ncbi:MULTISPECIES: hypothetical protein [unclassified Aeromicrobium]|uniref:hypothetical protein n=1 Tax=unclassified Aeromicrobium TaxID=2633570 RepID=UPI00396B110D